MLLPAPELSADALDVHWTQGCAAACARACTMAAARECRAKHPDAGKGDEMSLGIIDVGGTVRTPSSHPVAPRPPSRGSCGLPVVAPAS